MNVQELYQQKLTTAEEAVKIVKSGDWITVGAAISLSLWTRLWLPGRTSCLT